MDVLITPVGSAGDNYPFIGLGTELARRGHRVSVLTNDHFAPIVRGLGLEFISTGTDEEYRRVINNPDIWHPRKGFKHIMAGLGEVNGRLFDLIRPRIDNQTLIVAGTLDFASRTIAEKEGIPAVVTLHLSPSIPRTLYQVPTLTGTTNLSRLPRFLKRAMWKVVDWYLINPNVAPILDALRARVGLAPDRKVFDRAIHSPLLTVGMWPEWFAPTQPDCPPFFKLTGFPLFDAPDAQPMPPDVADFCQAGDPPLVFTPGSANIHGHEFFQAAVDAARLLDRRALLLTRFADQIPADLPPTVRHVPFAPFTQLLPRCAALVHHGGIGTTSAALAAGIPQLIMPLSHDQPDNAARVIALNAGDRLMPKHFRGTAVAKILSRLLESPDVKAACALAAQRCAARDALRETADRIESAIKPAAARTADYISAS
ncbi:MAG TPA: glycosyltransferase [Tepidisphaeraceae bacterium]|jgi:UDP:flavonoid glycosyltransferase YjiC (YdhE family)